MSCFHIFWHQILSLLCHQGSCSPWYRQKVQHIPEHEQLAQILMIQKKGLTKPSSSSCHLHYQHVPATGQPSKHACCPTPCSVYCVTGSPKHVCDAFHTVHIQESNVFLKHSAKRNTAVCTNWVCQRSGMKQMWARSGQMYSFSSERGRLSGVDCRGWLPHILPVVVVVVGWIGGAGAGEEERDMFGMEWGGWGEGLLSEADVTPPPK